MSLRSTQLYENIATLESDEDVTPMIFSQDFRNCIFTLVPSVDFSWSLEFYTSNNNGNNRPDLSQPASSSNVYSGANVIDLTDWSSYSNTSPLTYAGWEGIKGIQINQNLNILVWCRCKSGTSVTGSVTISVAFADNQ